jgi:hypothetical protein
MSQTKTGTRRNGVAAAAPLAALALVLAAAPTGCGARTELTDSAGDIDASGVEAGRVDAVSDTRSTGDGGDGAATDGGVECPTSEPAVASPCPLDGYQCFYFPPDNPQSDIYVYYCQNGVWSASNSEVHMPDCNNVACIQVPAQCIMGACQRCTCGSDGFYDDCGPC